MNKKLGKLYIVATPIGNLEDLTFRAKRILGESDLVVSEDTRKTKVLLDRYEIDKPQESFHEHSDRRKLNHLIESLCQGTTVSYVTDAGTPGISDPGQKLVDQARENEIPIIPIPGPSAVTALISVAGVKTDKFLFIGFLPTKKGREKVFTQIASSDAPVIFYESTHRIEKTLTRLTEVLPDNAKVTIGRELTKKFEEIVSGTAAEVVQKITGEKTKGEFVILVTKGKNEKREE